MSKFLLTLPCLIIFHAGYSANEYLNFIKLSGLFTTEIPLDVIVECIVACILTAFILVFGSGDFKNIRYDQQNCKLNLVGLRPNFVMFKTIKQ
jgi:hypothetical protein